MTPPKDNRRRAIALRYDIEQDAAPRVVAQGAGVLAERILEIARKHGIHVHADPDLTALLAKLGPQQPIPESLYRAVAEVLALVYRLNQERGQRRTGGLQ